MDFEFVFYIFRNYTTKNSKFLNRIITGIKLVLEKGIYSIKIQQGFLGPNGTIDEKTVGWKDVNYEYSDGRNLRTKTLGFGNNRIYLYDTMAPEKNSVLVGLYFLYFEGRGLVTYSMFANFDFKTGKLLLSNIRPRQGFDLTKT